MNIVAFDTETFRISKEAVLPKVVCLSLAARDGDTVRSVVYGNADAIEDTFRGLLEDQETFLVGHTTSYDLGVLVVSYPRLIPLVFNALEAGRITCTRVREKLLNVGDFGKLKARPLPDGNVKKLYYDLEGLARSYSILRPEDFGSDAKTAADSWRTNYSMLDGRHAYEYPHEAIAYAAKDAEWTLKVFEAQQFRDQSANRGNGSFLLPEFVTTAEDFTFRLATASGIAIDGSKIEEVKEHLEELLKPENMSLLIESGILRPAQPPRPYKNAKNRDGTVKMTKGKPESVNKKELAARVVAVAYANSIPTRMTEPTERYPEGQVSTDSEVISDLSEFDPVLAQYAHRQEQQKVVQEIAKLDGYSRCFPNYDVIKETLRTSSFGNKVKAGEEPIYPSVNIQQQDNRVRGIFIPDDGWLLGSCDYSSLELVSLAQTLLRLFGRSQLADLLLEGIDPHGYLGAQLAYRFSHDFREAANAANATGDKKTIFRYFASCKTAESPEAKKFYSHWRTFAKPVGLGYPGGLGAKTFVAFAKATYGVVASLDEAKEMKELWFEVFPEMRDFFEYINTTCVDPRNEGLYTYTTPLGFRRAGASFCAACNGVALQSPSAEGAKLAHYRVTRAMVDPSLGSILYGCRAPGFIHDEILFQVPEDDMAHDRAMEVSRIMVETLADVMPDMRPAIKAEPALMRRWNKKAEPVFDNRGRLTVWEP